MYSAEGAVLIYGDIQLLLHQLPQACALPAHTGMSLGAPNLPNLSAEPRLCHAAGGGVTCRASCCPGDGEGRWADVWWSTALWGHVAAQAEPADGFHAQIWALRAWQGSMCPKSGSLDVFKWCEAGSEPYGRSSAEGAAGQRHLRPSLGGAEELGAEQDTGSERGLQPSLSLFFPPPLLLSPQTSSPPRDLGSEVARLPLGFWKPHEGVGAKPINQSWDPWALGSLLPPGSSPHTAR